MMAEPITFHSLRRFYLLVLISIILLEIFGFAIVTLHDFSAIELVTHMIIAAVFPLLFSIWGYFIGWKHKRESIEYSPIDWQFVKVHMTLEQVERLKKEHVKKYGRILATPNIWYYYVPILLMIVLFAVPLYAALISPWLLVLVPLLFMILINSIFLISVVGGWRSTSTEASADFSLPLLTEATTLGRIQARIAGVSKVSVALEAAEYDGYSVYRDPSIVLRVRGIEQQAYIESWATELGSIDRVLIRLVPTDDTPDIYWWWSSRDRWFRKFIAGSDDSYYVRNPVQSDVKELGVKDVQLVTRNAICILLLEWLKLHGENDSLIEILEMHGASPKSS